MYAVANRQLFASNANTHTDVPLSDLAYTRMGELDEHISSELLPDKEVSRGSDKYYKSTNNHYKIPETHRSSIGDARMVDFDYTTGSYYATMKSLAHFIPDELIQDADPVIKVNYEEDATMFLTWMILQDKEKRTATLLFNSSVITNNEALSGTAMWDDYDNSNPIAKLKERFETMHLKGGKLPSKIVFNPVVWRKTSEHPLVVNRVSDYGRSTKGVSTKVFEEILDQMGFANVKVIVPLAVMNTSVEGSSDNFSYIWSSKHVLLAYVDPSANYGTMKKTLGACFRPSYLSGIYINKYRLPNKLGTFIEVNAKYDLVVTNSEMAYLIMGATN